MIKDEAVEICNMLIKYFSLKKEEVTTYITEIKQYDFKSVKKALEDLSNEKYKPTVAQIKNMIISNQKFENANFNSSYWYTNLREWCEENNKPYYDITTGKPLEPF